MIECALSTPALPLPCASLPLPLAFLITAALTLTLLTLMPHLQALASIETDGK